MRQPQSLLRSAALYLFALVVLLSLSSVRLAAQAPIAQMGPESTRMNGAYPISGQVSAGPEGSPAANGARVELRAVSGSILQTISTAGNGNFAFNNVVNGEYYIYVEMPGFDPLNQVIEVEDRPILQLHLELRATPDPAAKDAAPAGTPSTSLVSARELSIPHKAHDAFQKGMAALYGKNDYKRGLAEFQNATQAFPGYYEAYLQTGIAYMKLGQPNAAEEAFHKSIEASSQTYADAYTYLALLYSSDKRYADAEPLARKATELDKNSWLALTELVRSLYGQNKFEEAETSGQAAVQLKPDEPSLYLMLADVHLKLHDYDALLQDFNTYLKLAPNGEEAPHVKATRDKLEAEMKAAGQDSPAPAPDSAPATNP